ncbi:MAG: acyl-CoA thioesterase [Thermoplasmata archaeon]|nr:acyl-CoA thioesterase [Thermoplasmata archaeon]
MAESRSSVARLTLPTDVNFMGNVFGGVILEDIDRVAYITATRHSGLNAVTASFDRVDFERPVHVGQVLDFDAHLTFVGRSSMEVAIEVRAEALMGGPKYRVARAWVTMVAVDPEGRPVPVRPLSLRSSAERKEFEAGRQRMEERRRHFRSQDARGQASPSEKKMGANHAV